MDKLLVCLVVLGAWLAWSEAQFPQQFQQGAFQQGRQGQGGFSPARRGGNPNERLKLQVIRHQPCRSRNRPPPRSRGRFGQSGRQRPPSKVWKWNEKVRFPNSSVSTLQPDFEQGCYRIHGDILVNERLSDRAQMYLMVHYSVDPREGPEQCHGYDPNTGCGGWGSCLYCDACRAITTGRRTLQAVSLTRNGQQISCYEDLTRGVHQNIELKFCMPTKQEFLRNQGWTEQTWDSLVGSRARGHAIGVFLTITVFDEPQNYWVNQQRLQEQQYRLIARIPAQEKIPMSVQRDWAFYSKVVKENEGFVGCHRIYGNLIVQQ